MQIVYSINAFGFDASGSALGIDGESRLKELSMVSGGMWFSRKEGVRLDGKLLAMVFELIAEDLKGQYSIGFLPAVSNGDKSWHRIKVKLVTPSGAAKKRSICPFERAMDTTPAAIKTGIAPRPLLQILRTINSRTPNQSSAERSHTCCPATPAHMLFR